MADDHEQIYADFKEAVNMAPAELEKFLDTDESQEVGQKRAGQARASGMNRAAASSRSSERRRPI